MNLVTPIRDIYYLITMSGVMQNNPFNLWGNVL